MRGRSTLPARVKLPCSAVSPPLSRHTLGCRVLEVQRLARVHDAEDGMGRNGGLTEPLQDQLQLAWIVNDIADCEDAWHRGLAGRWIDLHMMLLAIQSPGGDRTEIHRQTEEWQQDIRGQPPSLALQRRHFDMPQLAIGT